jgi:salicylate hydroxylase
MALTVVQMLDQPDQWALFNHEAASTYRKGSVVLLGDAAHATTPHQGAGAGQAVEDALFLAVLLDKASTEGISFAKAFEIYDSVRRPRSQRVVSTSRAAGDTYAMTGPAGSDHHLLREELLQRFNWIWEYNIEEELEAALVRLQETDTAAKMLKGLGSDWLNRVLISVAGAVSVLGEWWTPKTELRLLSAGPGKTPLRG